MVAISLNHLTHGQSAAAATSFTTASVTPTGNRLLLLAVNAITNSSTTPPTPTITAFGLTWVLIPATAPNYDAAGTTDRAVLFLFRAMGGSPSSGTATIDFGATTISHLDWSLEEFDGVDATGTNGSGAVVQSATSIVNTTSISVTLAAFADATNNAAYGTMAHEVNQVITQGTGFTSIANPRGTSNSKNGSLLAEWVTGEDTSVDASWVTSTRAGGIAVEIKAGSSSTPISGTDTGAGTDAAAVEATATASDTGAGTDATLMAASLSSADTGTGTDTGTVAATITAADTAATTESATVDTGATPKAGADTGSSSETGTVAASQTRTDTGAGTDATTLVATLTRADTSAGTEAATVAAATAQAEAATATDSASVTVQGQTVPGTSAPFDRTGPTAIDPNRNGPHADPFAIGQRTAADATPLARTGPTAQGG